MKLNEKVRFSVLLVCLCLCLTASTRAQKFHPSDPLMEDDDRVIDVTEPPEYLELSDLYDRFGHIFSQLGDPNFSEALNVNSLDEVPNSSWFTNRHGVRRMTIEELTRGANLDPAPATDEEWTVIKGKSQGITPGFQIIDSRGDRYVIKLDPVAVPELSSSAESIATKIHYAVGYNVPQNHVVYYQPERLVIRPGTMVEDSFGDEVKLTKFRLTRMLRKVPRLADGKIRVIASKFIEGQPLGPFRYYDTRPDDPNDVIPHEHRRELRGLRLIAAWTNHDDTRAHNTQDSLTERNGRKFIKHYLMDFGSTFGSGSVDLQLPNLSFHYWLSMREVKKNAIGFGFRVPEYRRVDWPQYPKFQSAGRWESKHFDPEKWRNDYPNPAFVRATPRDMFWAAKILMRFTREELQAIVKTGEYSDPDVEAYFLKILLERQRKCGRWGFSLVNPLDGFQVSMNELVFENLFEKYGFDQPGQSAYEVSWWLFDNRQAERRESLGETVEAVTRSTLPEPTKYLSDRNTLLLAEVRTRNSGHPNWGQKIAVYLRSDGTGYRVVGIERESPAEPIGME